MSVCFPASQSSINAVIVKGRTRLLMSSNFCSLQTRGTSCSFSSSFYPGKSETNYVALSICRKPACSMIMGQTIKGGYLGSCCSKPRGNTQVFSSVVSDHGSENRNDDCDESNVKLAHGKKVHTDYSVIGIPGDGRCMFRSVAHGACLRSGKPPPNERLQKELADDLRAKVADEFIKRKAETEWFIEGDFDSYISQIRKPHVWGGEPELFIASHVLQMPITVYMYDKDAGGLISIAEYGQEYGKENPIRVLYHGFGHYDALDIPRGKGPKSRL